MNHDNEENSGTVAGNEFTKQDHCYVRQDTVFSKLQSIDPRLDLLCHILRDPDLPITPSDDKSY